MFPEQAKIANVRPIYRKDKREKIKNYRLVSVLSSFAKIYEKWIRESITTFVDKFLSDFLSAYGKAYSTNHVFFKIDRTIGKCVLIASLMIYLLRNSMLMTLVKTAFCSYLKRLKQNVKINNTYSLFKKILSGVRQGSILGSILFNIFIDDLFLWLSTTDLHNFTDDSTI